MKLTGKWSKTPTGLGISCTDRTARLIYWLGDDTDIYIDPYGTRTKSTREADLTLPKNWIVA